MQPYAILSHGRSCSRASQQCWKTPSICKLSTLQRLHVGKLNFPLSLLNNIKCFSLSGPLQIPECSDNTNPQLTALSFDDVSHDHLKFFIIWAKQHIVKLQTLKCNYLSVRMISEPLEVCSDTLNTLDFWFKASCELSS